MKHICEIQENPTIKKLIDLKNHYLDVGEGGCGKEKRQFYSEFKNKHVGEIGFNCGFSACAFLSVGCIVQSFDLAVHPYVDEAYKILKDKFGERIKLKKADSIAAVPNYKGEKFDLILIDGGHDFKTCYYDILHMREHAKKNTILLIDDFGGDLKHEREVTGAVLTLKYLNIIQIKKDHRNIKVVECRYVDI